MGLIMYHKNPRCLLFSIIIFPIKKSNMFDMQVPLLHTCPENRPDKTKHPALHFFSFIFIFVVIFFFLKRIKLSKLFDFKIVFLWPIYFNHFFRNVKFDVFGRNQYVRPLVVLFVVVFFHLVLRFYQTFNNTSLPWYLNKYQYTPPFHKPYH